MHPYKSYNTRTPVSWECWDIYPFCCDLVFVSCRGIWEKKLSFFEYISGFPFFYLPLFFPRFFLYWPKTFVRTFLQNYWTRRTKGPACSQILIYSPVCKTCMWSPHRYAGIPDKLYRAMFLSCHSKREASTDFIVQSLLSSWVMLILSDGVCRYWLFKGVFRNLWNARCLSFQNLMEFQ